MLYVYKAKLDRVVDGDTIDATIDLGFDTWAFRRIRLAGIDAPETRTRDLVEKQAGFASKERLEALLGPVGSPFVLHSLSLDKYGRVLGVLWVDDKNINDTLLQEGHAEIYK
jgi:micrococcal nuclease